jgi:putative ATP-dependent endonuclease of OLD family
VRISALAVTNHSRIPDLTVSVRQHAVIVGANDVGKSSILRLLNLTLGASIGVLYQRLSKSDLRTADQPLVVDVTLADFTDAERALFTSEIHIAEDGTTESLHVQLSVEQDPEDDDTVAIRRWFPRAGHERAPTL